MKTRVLPVFYQRFRPVRVKWRSGHFLEHTYAPFQRTEHYLNTTAVQSPHCDLGVPSSAALLQQDDTLSRKTQECIHHLVKLMEERFKQERSSILKQRWVVALSLEHLKEKQHEDAFWCFILLTCPAVEDRELRSGFWKRKRKKSSEFVMVLLDYLTATNCCVTMTTSRRKRCCFSSREQRSEGKNSTAPTPKSLFFISIVHIKDDHM